MAGVIVVKYGGSAMENPAKVAEILKEIASLAQEGFPVVLVHGGGKEISAELERRGLKAVFAGGFRVTDEAALAAIGEGQISSTSQYYAAIAELQSQRAAAMATATTEAYANDFVDSAYWDWKGDGKNGQVFMRQNADALQPYYDLASKGNPTDTAYWRRIGRNIAREFFGWTGNDFAAIDSIIMRESKWNPQVANATSSARGIPQTMMSEHFGDNWENNPQAQRFLQDPVWQIVWLMNYIKGRYGTPQAALAFKDANKWY